VDAYSYFSNGIFQLLLGTWKEQIRNQAYARPPTRAMATVKTLSSSKRSSRTEDNWNESSLRVDATSPLFDVEDKISMLEEFVNVSLTPLECSVICPTELVEILFGHELYQFGEKFKIRILKDEYLAIEVDGDGQDHGARVLDLSTPLSIANIPIFFIATYFADYVLVPVSEKDRVIKALESKGFEFSDIANSYVSLSSRQNGDADNMDSSDSNTPVVPLSPELDQHVFEVFEKFSVAPQIDRQIKLLLTGARTGDTSHDALYLSIIKALLGGSKYFSLTVAAGTEISFLVDSETASLFPKNALLGSPTDFVIPVCYDLHLLPEDSTGIVTAVAGRLTGKEPIHMSYLSTAKAGIVLVSEDDLEHAITVLS
jgi:hypothetical protein